nr:MAG: FAD-dependent oxidoreductase [Hyphomicrobiales bacterium]
MMRPIHRREILTGVAAALMAPAISRGAIPAGPETIIIIGGGLAGLTAAHRLRETGRRVIVLEARDDVGGRVRTIRSQFDNGLYGEAGAARISDVHVFVQHWLNKFDLNMVPFSPSEGHTVFALDGMSAFSDDPNIGERLGLNLREDERNLSPGELANKYLEGLPDNLRSSEIDNEALASWAEFDDTNWPDWLRRRGASDAAVRLLTLGADSSEISALYVLRQIFLHRAGRGYFRIEGGMDRLPRALAEALGDNIRTNCEVTALSQTASGVQVQFREDGETKTVTGSQAIIAVPFTLLRDIKVEPALSAEKRTVIANTPYRSSIRFLLQTDRPFWRNQDLSGAARTSAPCEIWDGSFGQLSVNGLLSVTAGGQPAMRERFAGLAADEQLRLGITMAQGAFRDFGDHYQKGITQNWTNDPWSRGAFAVSYPGQMTRWGTIGWNPEGRIHFAGEHVSPWPGWMEGALWSAERAVQEIL